MFKIFLSGAAIGIANILPGVSGGTIAVIINLYDQIIISINDVLWERKNLKSSLIFLILLFTGASLGLFIFSYLIDYILVQFPKPFFAYLCGLILGSIPYIINTHILRFSWKGLIISLSSLFFIIWLSLQTTSFITLDNSTYQMLFLGFTGLIAASTMIIPGVSGSLVLILLGTYTHILTAVKALNFNILLPVCVGAALGLIGTSKLMGYLLKTHPSMTYFCIVGLLFGSIFKLGLEGQLYNLHIQEFIIVTISLIFGFITCRILEKKYT